MNNSLWKIVVVVAAFLGFIIGYSVPPMVEVGIFSGHDTPKASAEVSEEMKDYYDDLLKEK